MREKNFILKAIFIHSEDIYLNFESNKGYTGEDGQIWFDYVRLEVKQIQDIINKYGEYDEMGFNCYDAYLLLGKGYNTLGDLLDTLREYRRIPENVIKELAKPNGRYTGGKR